MTRVKIGTVWWTGTRPVWMVDGFDGDAALLARWRPTEAGLERVERTVPTASLALGDADWREAPDALAEEMQREVVAARRVG